jgi:hypothetical protein
VRPTGYAIHVVDMSDGGIVLDMCHGKVQWTKNINQWQCDQRDMPYTWQTWVTVGLFWTCVMGKSSEPNISTSDSATNGIRHTRVRHEWRRDYFGHVSWEMKLQPSVYLSQNALGAAVIKRLDLHVVWKLYHLSTWIVPVVIIRILVFQQLHENITWPVHPCHLGGSQIADHCTWRQIKAQCILSKLSNLLPCIELIWGWLDKCKSKWK